MSAEKVRRLLGSLLDDPENESAWNALEESAIGGELAAESDLVRGMLEAQRRRYIAHGEAEAAARMLDLEVLLTVTPADQGPLLRERARILEEELLDDRAAVAALDARLALGADTDAQETRERLLSKKARWKDIAAAYKRSAENDSTDPAMIASHLVSAAGIVLQYKQKGRDKEADAIFEAALSVDPGNLRAIQLYERVLRRRANRWDDLAAHLERSADAVSDPDAKVDLLFRAARTHAGRRGDIASAERIYRKVLDVRPGDPQATRFIVAILTDRERWDDLADFYEAQLAAREGDPDVGLLVQAGMIHWRTRGDREKAEPFFRRLRESAPEHPAAVSFFAEAAPEVKPEPEAKPAPARDLNPDELPTTVMSAVSLPPAEPARETQVEAAHDDEVAITTGDEEEIEGSLPPEEFHEPARAAEPAARTEAPPAPEPEAAPAAEPERTPTPVVSVAPEAPAAQADAPQTVAPPAPATEAPPAAAPAPRPSSAGVAAVRPSAAPNKAAVTRLQMALDLAQSAQEQGQTDRAIDAWKAVLRLEPTHADARASLLSLYASAGRWNNLVELHRQELDALGGVRPGPELMSHRERKLELLREMVEIYRDRLGLEPMVVQTWNSILLLEPGDLTALKALGQSYEKLGRYTDVIKVLDQQVEHTEDPAEKVALLRRVAQLWLERFNNVNNATRPLEQIVSIDPRDVDAVSQLKDLYTRRRAWRPLFEVSRREAESLEGDAKRDALADLAKLAAERLGANADAIALWREALAIDPETPGALDALERLTERERDWAGLAEVLERRATEATDPEQRAAVLMKLGAVYSERMDDPARSVDAWRRVLAAQPKHPKAMRVLRDAYTAAGQWDNLESLYADTGDWEGLTDVLGSAAERAAEPETKVALSFRAARVFEEKLGQPERAFRNYERVLSVDPKNVAAARALEPIYTREEKWPRLAQLYEVLLEGLDAGEADAALGYLRHLRELASTRLGDRAAAFRWALRAYQIAPTDPALESQLERSAADAGAWAELVETFDARSSATADPDEAARLRDKAAEIEADRLGRVDAAIARYHAALRESPDDGAVIATLDGLLRRAGRYAELRDLYDHRLSRAEDSFTRRVLIGEVAEVEERHLSDPDAASARFRKVIADDPDDADALVALSRLAESGARWGELAQLLATRRDAASGDARAELAFRLGEVRLRNLDDTDGAITSFREVLALSPHHPQTLAALETLLRDEAWRTVAARILEPEFEASGEHQKLAWALQILFDGEPDAARKRALGLRLARVYADRLSDPRSGFELLRAVLDAQPDAAEVADTLTELAVANGWAHELAETLGAIVDREALASDVRVALARRTASLHEDRLGDALAAERFHRVVVDAGLVDANAYGALRAFYQQHERWSDLRALYRRWVEVSPEDRAKVDLLMEEARLVEEVLDQRSEAAAVYARVLELDATNRDAARALDRLLDSLGRWEPLAEHLTRMLDQPGVDADEARELRFRRGALRELQLGQPEGALDDYTSVVAESPAHAGAREGLERLLEVPSLRQRAGTTLEGLYESEGDASAAALVRALRVRLEFTTDPSERSRIFQRVAEIEELVLSDVTAACDAAIEALLAEPASGALRDEMLRLSAAALQDARAAQTLEAVAEEPRAASALVEVLRDLANVYDERLIDPAKAERTWRRLLAAAPDDTAMVTTAAVALERLYRALQNPRGLVEALTLRAKHEDDAELRRSLYAQAGEILEDEVGDLAGAIAAQRERLIIDPTDRDALKALARLYEKTSAWEDLVAILQREAQLADDGDEQKSLRVRAASVLEERVADVPGAVATYRDVIEAFGPDRAVYAALARLYELSDQWPELLGALEQDLLVAESSADRLALTVRIAELQRTRTHAPRAAVEGYRAALDIDPAEPTARAALEGMLRSDEPGIPLAAARALDPVLQGEQSWEKLLGVLDRIAADSDDSEERRAALSRAAEVSEIGLGDPSRAFDRAAQRLRDGLTDDDLASQLAHVEGLARSSRRHADLVKLLQEVGPEVLDPTLQRAVYMKVADVAREDLSDRDTARAWYEKTLDLQPDFAPALDALESLHEEAGAWDDLLAVLRRKTDLAASDDARRSLLRRQAVVCEEKRSDRAGAIAALESILDMGFDAEAAASLERLYALEGRWNDLAGLLEGQLSVEGADVPALHHRLGLVALRNLNDVDRAADHFREVLERDPDHGPTVEALEDLGRREGWSARAAAMLEPIYRGRMDMPKLIAALEARIAEADAVDKRELLGRLGALYEENLGDLDKALDTHARVFREDISDREAWEVLTRLARSLDRWGRLAAIYGAAVDAADVDDDTTAELAFRAAQLLDEKVNDTAAARRYYHRALAFDPTRSEVFAALEALLRRESAWPELLTLYRDAADRATDPDERKAYLFKVATLDEEQVGDLPTAIADYRAILDVDPTDRDALARLDALLVRTEAWRDLAELLEGRVLDAADVEERAVLRFRLGRLRADRLDDPRGAIDAFREILEETRDHRPAIQALEALGESRPELRLSVVEVLEPIYRELDDWSRLAGVLEARLAASEDRIERGELLRELGRIREDRGNDPRAAFTAYSQAFATDPGDGEAREAVERIAAQSGMWDDLVQSYETALAATEDLMPRTYILRALAQTHDQRRGDPRAAITAYNRLFEVDDTQLDVLDQLEGLHVLLSDWEGHVEVLERKVARSLDDDHRKFLLQTIGESQRDMMGNAEAAIDAFQRALEIDPTDAVALDALDGLYAQKGDHAALADVLQRRLDVEPDAEIRRETAVRLGRLWETELKDELRAVEAYRRALDDNPNEPQAIAALERLYTRLEQWDDLLENLRAQAALAPEESARTALKLRVGALLAGQVGDPNGALETYREVLAVDPTNAAAIAAVRRLAESPELTSAAVETLEPIFRSASRWDDLVETLELKLKNLDDPTSAGAELRSLAAVHEDGRGDLGAAFDTWRRAFHEDPSDRGALKEMERLAGALERWGDLVSLLEEESRAAMDPTVARDLSVRAAQLASERLGDADRAIANYQHAVEQAGDDDELLEPLDRLYTHAARWRDLHDVLERRLAIAGGDALDALEVRVGELREKRFDDAPGALSAWRNVVDRDPSNAQALAGLERLLANAAVRDDVMEVLEGAYQRNDDAQNLGRLLAMRVESAEVSSDRVRLLGELARLREDRLGDLTGALSAVIEAFKADPRDEQFALEAERLAPASGSWESLRGVVESVLSAHDDLGAMDIAALNLRAAGWYRDHLGDSAAAESRLTAALDAEPENLDALEALEALQRAPGRARDLVATLRRRAEVELDLTRRAELLKEAATLAETDLGDADLAAELATLRLDADDTDVDALDQLARLRRAQGRFEEVADLLARRARLLDDPTEAARLRREVASLYAGEIGDIDRAVDAWREVIDFDINDAQARGALEGLLEASGRNRDLEEALRGRLDVCVTAEERAGVRMRLARLAEGPLGDRVAAAEYLREVLEESPTHAEAGRELERIYTEEKRWSDLADLLERRLDEYLAAGDTAGELTTLVRIGELHERELGDRARAVDLYERVLDRQPDHAGALAAIARLAEADGQWDRAVEMLRRALPLAPAGEEGARMAIHLATLERERSRDDAAAEASLRRALELDPNNAQALAALKDLARARNDHALLADVMEREVAVVENPKQKVLLLKNLANLGRAELNDASRATAWLEQARALAPEDRDVLLPLVDLYSAGGREADTLPIIEGIIASFGGRRSKELAQWQHRLGQAHERMGDELQALSLYDAAFKIDLTNVPILRDLGLLCLRTGDLERAQKTFRALLLQRLDPTAGITKADVYFYLGDTLARAGDKPKAIGMLERAVESDREHERAKGLLAELKG